MDQNCENRQLNAATVPDLHVGIRGNRHGINSNPSLLLLPSSSQSPSLFSVRSGHIPMPKWAQDESISLHSRTSRASSTVSTSNITSARTSQEETRSARSVDIVLGNRSFHISRDGSRVTSQEDDLPPYTPPARERMTETSYPVDSDESSQSSPTTPTGQVSTPVSVALAHDWEGYRESQRAPPAMETRTTSSTSPRGINPGLSTSFSQRAVMVTLNPSGPIPKAPTPVTIHDQEGSEKSQTVWRSPSFDPGPETLSVASKRRAISHGDIQKSSPALLGSPLRRRNGIRLPKIITGFTGGRLSTTSLPENVQLSSISPSDIHYRHSAGPSFESSNGSSNLPQSPTFIGHDATGRFPSSIIPKSKRKSAPVLRSGIVMVQPGTDTGSASPQGPIRDEEHYLDTNCPPPMDTENDISFHYIRLIRTIDRDHRRVLHQRDKELSGMRERLNEVDQVYRQQLRERDFTIDDLRQRLAADEERIEKRVERARHEVEDYWETLWKDRDRHMVERMRRIELESQRCVERAISERDEEWAAEWAKRNEQLLQRLKTAEAAVARGSTLSS